MKTKFKFKMGSKILSSLLAIVIFNSISAQIPTLTTDDIVPTQTVEKVKSETPVSTLSDKVEISKKDVKSAEKKGSNPEADAWSEKYMKAFELTKKLNYEADQVELDIVKLRNQIQSPNGKQPGEYNTINQQISGLVEKSKKLKRDALNAESKLSEISSVGKEQNFKLKEQSFKDEKGNLDHREIEKATLQIHEEIKQAEAHIDLKKLELSRLRSELLKKGNADQFARNRIDKEKSQAELEIQDSIKKIEELKKKKLQTAQYSNSTAPQ